jgi:hypothetical protein
MDDLTRLFFADDEDLAAAGATYALADAEQGKYASALRAAEAQALSNERHAKQDAMHTGSIALSDDLTQLRVQHDALSKDYFERAVIEHATINHADAAEQFTRRAQGIASLSGAIEYYQATILPTARLEALRADERLYFWMAQLSSWAALESAVTRHQNSAALQESEGSVSYGPFGKTHSLLLNQLAMHKRAADMAEAVQTEEMRQRARKELIV